MSVVYLKPLCVFVCSVWSLDGRLRRRSDILNYTTADVNTFYVWIISCLSHSKHTTADVNTFYVWIISCLSHSGTANSHFGQRLSGANQLSDGWFEWIEFTLLSWVIDWQNVIAIDPSQSAVWQTGWQLVYRVWQFPWSSKLLLLQLITPSPVKLIDS